MGLALLLWCVLTPVWILFVIYLNAHSSSTHFGGLAETSTALSKMALIPPALTLVALAFRWLHKRSVVAVAGASEAASIRANDQKPSARPTLNKTDQPINQNQDERPTSVPVSQIGKRVHFGHSKKATGGNEGTIIDEIWADPDFYKQPVHPHPCPMRDCGGDHAFCTQLIEWGGGQWDIRFAHYRRHCGEERWKFASQATVVASPKIVKALCERTLAKDWFRSGGAAVPETISSPLAPHAMAAHQM